MRRFVAAVAAAGLIVAGASSASAAQKKDGADSGLSIDVSSIEFVEKSEDIGKLTIETHSGWKCRELRPAAKTSLKWLFDGSGDNAFDLVGSFVCRRGDLLFELRSKDGDNRYEPIAPKRPNRRTVTVTMPLDLPEIDSDNLDLVVKSKDLSGVTCIEDCIDRAPNRGRMKAY